MTVLRLVEDEFDEEADRLLGEDAPAGEPTLEDRRAQQIAKALVSLDADYSGAPTWNRPALDTITGPILPGELWIVLAREKMGKTTFIMNAIAQWDRQGLGVYYWGTEEEALAAQIRYAAIQTGNDPGAIAGRDFGPEPEATKREIREAVKRIGRSKLFFADCTRPTLADVKQAAWDAKEKGMSLLVLDHFHRMAVPESLNHTATIAETVRQIKQLTTETQLSIVMMAQAKRGTSRLMKYMPPPPDGGLGTSALEQEANVVLGLYKPFQPGKFTRGSEKQFEMGVLTESDLLMPNTMGVKTLLHRRLGHLMGERCHLHCERGMIANKLGPDMPVYGGTT